MMILTHLVTVVYFIMVIVGFAFKKIEFQTEQGTKWAGYNVFTLFMVMQCACKYYGGHAGLVIYLFSAVASYILLPGRDPPTAFGWLDRVQTIKQSIDPYFRSNFEFEFFNQTK